jgi:hypothetical protein
MIRRILYHLPTTWLAELPNAEHDGTIAPLPASPRGGIRHISLISPISTTAQDA